MNITKEDAYADGREAGEKARTRPHWLKMAENIMQWAKRHYPASEHLDYKAEVVKIERERLAADLDLTKFPECRGLREAVEAQHRGFRDGCGDEWMTAHQYNWYWFNHRRLNTRYVGKSAPKGKCTSVWFSDSSEGPLQGVNLDDIRRSFETFEPDDPPSGKPITKIRCVGGVSSAVLCDEEPDDMFPVNLEWITPPEIRTVREYVDFLQRYREFFGPGNQIYVDPELNSVAIEKSNCRMGVRWPTKGASAITACSYVTPEMNAFKKERNRISLEARGWTDDCPDCVYWDGCERRYHRLLALVDAEAERGPTLAGLASIMLDHAVPFPDRICLAGERGHRAEVDVNWTLMSTSTVVLGPTRRTLFWRVEGETPIYRTKPILVLGNGSA